MGAHSDGTKENHFDCHVFSQINWRNSLLYLRTYVQLVDILSIMQNTRGTVHSQLNTSVMVHVLQVVTVELLVLAW